MGTTTIFLRHNDLHIPLSSMKKNELKKIDELSPYRTENNCNGWRTPMELHNGNIHILVWWKGRLMRIEDAPKTLCNKYYDKYRGKTLPVYEWTLLKGIALKEIKELDRTFKKVIKEKRKANKELSAETRKRVLKMTIGALPPGRHAGRRKLLGDSFGRLKASDAEAKKAKAELGRFWTKWGSEHR